MSTLKENINENENLEVTQEQDYEPIYMSFHPSLRSQLMNTILMFLTLFGTIYFSNMFPITVVKGSLFPFFGDNYVYLSLPVLILIPGLFLGKILINIYDCKYIFDETGVEAQIGLVSFNLRQPRLRWEDIRGSEPQQTIFERMLNIGSVIVGSGATQDVEITLKGVADPKGLQAIIQLERSKRINDLRNLTAPKVSTHATSTE